VEPPQAAATARAAAVAFAVLLLATFGAFLLAARLKAQPAELSDIQRARSFSPNGDGRLDVEVIRFRSDFDDRAAVDIVDADGARVRRVADRLRLRPQVTSEVTWDGRDDEGRVAPDGQYRMRLILRQEGRAVLAGKPFLVDTEPPEPHVLVAEDDAVVAPGEPVEVKLRRTGGASSPRLEVLRTDVSPLRRVRTLTAPVRARRATWDGRDDAGVPVQPGTYLVAVTARDRAGNDGTSPPRPLERSTIRGRPGVTVRELAVQPPVRATTAGRFAAFRVDARGEAYRWQIRRAGERRPVRRSPRARRSTTLLLRAPEGPSGVYLLEISTRDAAVRVPFAVRAAEASPRGRPLVVLPMVTWLGDSPVDGTRDGLPDTFAAGASVAFPRLFGFRKGVPPSYVDEVSPLLRWLDGQEVRYDVTTDLSLSLGEPLSAEDRRGLLVVGGPRYVSRDLARRLRRYVGGGGHVAVIGPGAYRAGVTVEEGRLTGATPAGPLDAFGARLAERTLPDGSVLTVLEEDPAIDLLTGFAGTLAGFETVEELVDPGRDAQLATAVGQALTEEELAAAEEEGRRPRPERGAVSAVRAGEGLVLRVGLPGWIDRLVAGDAAVEQLTFNVLDKLRGVRPRPRTVG
jgi:hypothetical protein